MLEMIKGVRVVEVANQQMQGYDFFWSLKGCVIELQEYSVICQVVIQMQSLYNIYLLNMTERTYVMIKPDGVQRGLVGAIIARFEQKGFFLRALKLTHVQKHQIEQHYYNLKGQPFFPALVQYYCSSPVTAMVWQGNGVVAACRNLLGQTNPVRSKAGTIRGDFGMSVERNVCHSSDSVDSAERQISIWFTKEEMVEWNHHSHKWVYDK